MDVGGATHWSRERVVSRAPRSWRRLRGHYGAIVPDPLADAGPSSAPAERFRLPDGTAFGIIASTTAPFCRACDRSRLTADGQWYLCLYAARGLDLRASPARGGERRRSCGEIIASAWRRRADRGAEERLALGSALPCCPEPSSRGTPTSRCTPGEAD